jgi:hypothetical protein
MSDLQNWVYQIEAGVLRIWLVRIALFCFFVGLAAWIGISEFHGLGTREAMDLAQQARQLSTGKGFSTDFIRPLALWQLRSKYGNDAPPVTKFPETLSPPLYPVILGGIFRLGELSHLVKFKLTPEDVKGMRVYPPDYLILGFNLLLVLLSAVCVYAWAERQFDFGVAILGTAFFLGSTILWDQALLGGVACLVVFLYALAGCLLANGCCQTEQMEETGGGGGAVWYLLAGIACGLLPSVQLIQIWPVLAVLGLAFVSLPHGRWWFFLGVILGLGVFIAWLGRLWVVTGNPLGLNWAHLLADSSKYPGTLLWRSYDFDLGKTEIWRKIVGLAIRGGAFLISQGPQICGNALVGCLAVLALMHPFRRFSAMAGKTLWGVALLALFLGSTFVQREGMDMEVPPLLGLLPVACVFGAAFLWILIERWKLEIELLGQVFVVGVAFLVVTPTLSRLLFSNPAPFAYPPTYPPIFLYMRSWFEPNELESSDLPAAEAWYSGQPTLWIPSTREDFLKIHDRIAPVFSILFTPASSDTRLYSQILAEKSEWVAWADLIQRQKPPDLPQAFVTSLPPNNEYLLLSVQKRWN